MKLTADSPRWSFRTSEGKCLTRFSSMPWCFHLIFRGQTIFWWIFKVWWRQLWSTAWTHQRTAASSNRPRSDKQRIGVLCVLLAASNKSKQCGFGNWFLVGSLKWLCHFVWVKLWQKQALNRWWFGRLHCWITLNHNRFAYSKLYNHLLFTSLQLARFFCSWNRILSCSCFKIPVFQRVKLC